VAAPLPFSEKELRLLQVLLKREVRFMVVGLSAATLQGAPVVTQDVEARLHRSQSAGSLNSGILRNVLLLSFSPICDGHSDFTP
jgi:hypothetical protein